MSVDFGETVHTRLKSRHRDRWVGSSLSALIIQARSSLQRPFTAPKKRPKDFYGAFEALFRIGSGGDSESIGSQYLLPN